MENSMTPFQNSLTSAISEAAMPGDTTQPIELLYAIKKISDPIKALANYDHINRLTKIVHKEFNLTSHINTSTAPLSKAEISRWAALIRWLLFELNYWHPENDPTRQKLTAIFITSQIINFNVDLWELIPSSFSTNLELVTYLKKMISSFNTAYTTKDTVKIPIWEQEAVENFKTADAAGNWSKIGSMLGAFQNQIRPSVLYTQSVRCLYKCGIANLVDATASLSQTISVLQIANTLPVEQRLQLAERSENPYIHFGCAYQTLLGNEPARQLSLKEQQLFTALLIKVARHETKWRDWMLTFNTYPLRTPQLQIPLGKALAKISESAIYAYVDSIVLQTKTAEPNPSRTCVAECLREFRAESNLDRRALLWTWAHKRWHEWNFDQKNTNSNLFKINWSDLDYAIVGYACECMSDDSRTKTMNKMIDELQSIDNTWHTSSLSIITAWNRTLSSFQPYAHASTVSNNHGDWLTETATYLPYNPEKDEYAVMKYNL